MTPAKDSLNRGKRGEVAAVANCFSLSAQVRGCEKGGNYRDCYCFCFTGGHGERLCSPTFPVSPEAPAGPRTLVLLPTGQHDSVLLLQKCCEHLLPHCILLIIRSTVKGNILPDFIKKCHFENCFVPTDVCRAHLLVSVLLWILRLSHDWPVVSHLLQPDVFRLPTTCHWYSGQRRVSRDSPTSTSALRERPEFWGPLSFLSFVCFCVFIASACAVKFSRTIR